MLKVSKIPNVEGKVQQYADLFQDANMLAKVKKEHSVENLVIDPENRSMFLI